MKLKNKGKGKFVGLSSFIAVLAVLATAVFCPFDGNNANAAETKSQRLRIDFVVREALDSKRLTIDFFLSKSGDISYENIAKQLGIDFYIREKIYLGVNGLNDVAGNGGAEVTPVPEGTAVSGQTGFKVGTNNAGGLVVKVSGDPNMENQSFQGNVIKPTEGGKKLGTLTANTWGYNLSEGTVANNAMANLELVPVTTAAEEMMTLGNGDHDMTLSFGAKVTSGVASGTYSTTVKVDVATNATGRAIRDDNLRTIEAVFNQYMDEHPEYAAEVRAEQEKRRVAYQAELNGEKAPEQTPELSSIAE